MNTNWIKNRRSRRDVVCRVFTIIVLMFVANTYCFAQSYSELYPKECSQAKQFFAEHKNEFEQAGKNAGLSAEFLFAIVAPELSQFAYLSNKVETYSLKVMYVQGGKAYADFSIGFFQMKPSFIEQMENSVAADEDLKAKFSDYLFAEPNSRQARVSRIDRLNTTEWQLKYLTLFCVLVNKRFASVSFADEEEKLRFYASAYNAGVHRMENDIKQIGEKSLFPHFSRQKFRYADVALWFYKN